jgi:serine/threonine protein kinase
MGAVYRAWDTRLDVPVALKEMTPQPGLDPRTLAQLRQQFQREATVLARLDHPHLVGVTDFFEEGGNAYLVMKFIEGESLAQRIKREGMLPERAVLAWAGQLLHALAYCHAQGVIHRDIKPQNVIIRPDGQAVLVDFGLVKLWDPRDPRTRTAMRGMGTPEYAPPEQYDVQAGHTDARSDIYSLGATLYHALVGRTPPTATQRIVNPAALAPVRALNPRVSPQVEAALMQALELQPEARFQSTAEMGAALGRRPPTTPPPRRTTGTPATTRAPATPGRRAIPWTCIGLAAGAIVLVAALAGGLALGTGLLSGDSSPSPPAVAEASATPTGEVRAEDVTVATDTPTSPPPTATPAHTSVPSRTPQPTSTALPTATPEPTSTPLPTETPTPVCPAVSGPFAGIWQGAQGRLGCAVNQPHTTWMAEEHFERGRMFWREDTDLISALYDTGGWGSYPNTWHEGDPVYSCSDSAPAENPPTPIRGFGKTWCTYEAVRSGLGWATDPERGYDATAQDFERGSIVRTDGGTTYVLYADGRWERQ